MKPGAFLDYEKMPIPSGEYVLWCDGMGTGRQLSRALNRTASFVLRLHRAFAVAREKVPGVRCYPVMDGLYVTTPSNDDFRTLARIAFVQYAHEFISGRGTQNKFMMRAGGLPMAQ